MIIKSSEVKGENMWDILLELDSNEELREFIRAKNLNGGDFIYLIAHIICMEDSDVNINDIIKEG